MRTTESIEHLARQASQQSRGKQEQRKTQHTIAQVGYINQMVTSMGSQKNLVTQPKMQTVPSQLPAQLPSGHPMHPMNLRLFQNQFNQSPSKHNESIKTRNDSSIKHTVEEINTNVLVSRSTTYRKNENIQNMQISESKMKSMKTGPQIERPMLRNNKEINHLRPNLLNRVNLKFDNNFAKQAMKVPLASQHTLKSRPSTGKKNQIGSTQVIVPQSSISLTNDQMIQDPKVNQEWKLMSNSPFSMEAAKLEKQTQLYLKSYREKQNQQLQQKMNSSRSNEPNFQQNAQLRGQTGPYGVVHTPRMMLGQGSQLNTLGRRYMASYHEQDSPVMGKQLNSKSVSQTGSRINSPKRGMTSQGHTKSIKDIPKSGFLNRRPFYPRSRSTINSPDGPKPKRTYALPKPSSKKQNLEIMAINSNKRVVLAKNYNFACNTSQQSRESDGSPVIVINQRQKLESHRLSPKGQIMQINKPAQPIRCNSHGRELKKISMNNSQMSIMSSEKDRKETFIHSPVKAFSGFNKNSFKNQKFEIPLVQAAYSDIKQENKSQIMPFKMTRSAIPSKIVVSSPSMLILNKEGRGTVQKPFYNQIKIQEKIKPQENSMMAKESCNNTINSSSNSLESKSLKDEEISASEDEQDNFPHQQIESLKKNKFIIEQRIINKNINNRDGVVHTQNDPYSVQDKHNRHNENHRFSYLSGTTSQVTQNGRLETQLLDSEKRFPSKTRMVVHYTHDRKKSMTGISEHNKIKSQDIITTKERNLDKFECIVGNKLNLRLQNLKTLSISQFESKSNLTHLDLRNNRLKRLPDSICDLILMREIRLDYNFLQSLPYGLDKLQHLQFMSVSQNLLHEIPTTLMHKDSKLEYLYINDNKICHLQDQIGNLSRLKSLLVHNNQIYEFPLSIHKADRLFEFGLDWIMYLCRDLDYNKDVSQFVNQEFCLINPTKVLKGITLVKSGLKEENWSQEQKVQQKKHQEIIDNFMKMCKIMSIYGIQRKIETVRESNMLNPQQDDYDTERDAQLMNESQSRNDNHTKHRTYKSNRVTFLQFMLYFLKIQEVDCLVRQKTFHHSKQRKISHLIAMNGHEYLFKNIVKEISPFKANRTINNFLNQTAQQETTLYQFINAVDTDFSTPIILALKNKRQLTSQLLIQNDKTCLRQASMKFGTPLHVSLHNEDFKSALKILKVLKKKDNFQPDQDLNKFDEDGNTPLHLVMKNFSSDIQKSVQLAQCLLRVGASNLLKNRLGYTPIGFAGFYGQTEALRFAVSFNKQTRKRVNPSNLFMLNEGEGRLSFTPLHHAVFQNNFNAIALLLKSEEQIDLNKEDCEGRKALDLCFSISSVFKTIRKKWRQQRIQTINLANNNKRQRSGSPVDFKIPPYHHNINLTTLRSKKSNRAQITDGNLSETLSLNFNRKINKMGSHPSMSYLNLQNVRPAVSLNTTRLNSPTRQCQNERGLSKFDGLGEPIDRRERSMDHLSQNDPSSLVINLKMKSINEIKNQVSPRSPSQTSRDGILHSNFKNYKNTTRNRKIKSNFLMPDQFKKKLSQNLSRIDNGPLEKSRQVDQNMTSGTVFQSDMSHLHQVQNFKNNGGIMVQNQTNPSKMIEQNALGIQKKLQCTSSEEELEQINNFSSQENLTKSLRSQSFMSQISQIHKIEKEKIFSEKQQSSSSMVVSEGVEDLSDDSRPNSINTFSSGNKQSSQEQNSGSALDSPRSSFTDDQEDLFNEVKSSINVVYSTRTEILKFLLQKFRVENKSGIRDLSFFEKMMKNLQGQSDISIMGTYSIQANQEEILQTPQLKSAKPVNQQAKDKIKDDNFYNFEISDGDGAESFKNQTIMNGTLERVLQNFQNQNGPKGDQDLIFIQDEQDEQVEDDEENVFTLKQEDFRKSHESFDLQKVFEYQNEVKQELQTQKINYGFSQILSLDEVQTDDQARAPLNFSRPPKWTRKSDNLSQRSEHFQSNQSMIEDENMIGVPFQIGRNSVTLSPEPSQIFKVDVKRRGLLVTIIDKFISSDGFELNQIDRVMFQEYLNEKQLKLYNPQTNCQEHVQELEMVIAQIQKLLAIKQQRFFISLKNDLQSLQLQFRANSQMQSFKQDQKFMRNRPSILKTSKPRSNTTNELESMAFQTEHSGLNQEMQNLNPFGPNYLGDGKPPRGMQPFGNQKEAQQKLINNFNMIREMQMKLQEIHRLNQHKKAKIVPLPRSITPQTKSKSKK